MSLQEQLEGFQKGELKHTETKEKNLLDVLGKSKTPSN
jgi:hypothetical protein